MKICLILYSEISRKATTLEIRHGDRADMLGRNVVHADRLCDDPSCAFCRELAQRILSRTSAHLLEKRVYGL